MLKSQLLLAFAGFFVHLKGWFSGISGSGS